jgi:hypothetical protein
MKIKAIKAIRLGAIGLSFLILPLHAATLYVDLNGASPTPPFSDWNTAANTIQDAIDAASDGDLILVTNGVYQTGGAVMAGDLTNRVALTKAVTVQSVNGPWTTTILGASATNGTTAVRCAWLTNGASLTGFTLAGGATRTTGDGVSLQCGGGVWCASSNALVANCVIVSNNAAFNGGAVYQGWMQNSFISNNKVTPVPGSITYKAILNNCTIVSNAAYGAVSPLAMTNSIIYYNGLGGFQNVIAGNGGGITFSHCCANSGLSGPGNLTSPPQLFADGVHLNTNSPCIGAGIAITAGTDIFGNAWSNPPAIGCAEWTPAPLVSVPQIRLSSDPVGFNVGNLAIGTTSICSFAWLKDGVPLHDNGHFSGTQTTNLTATGVGFSDAGNYQVVVSNEVGMVTSGAATLVIHCVDANGTNPIPPYLNWTTAATNIQDAITAASAGDVVLVTNGLYASGGKSMDGIITNRVVIDKAILLQSVNGASLTTIQGAWDPISTNGPGAIRCVWMTNTAVMKGFTLTGGATRGFNNLANKSMYGGGILGNLPLTQPATNAMVWDCIIGTNSASYDGGGAYAATLIHCTVIGNSANSFGSVGSGSGGTGGGAGNCNLRNCLITLNSSYQGSGGGVDGCKLTNCAVIKNSSQIMGSGANNSSLVNCTVTANRSSSAAVYLSSLVNCIVFGNDSWMVIPNTNYISSTLVNCCADPLPAGTGNIDMDPQLLPDGIHLTETSPCIGAGDPTYVRDTDLDGQPWKNPPAIGCDEWQPAPVIGAQPSFQIGSPAHGLTLSVVAAGQTPLSFLWSKDGVPIPSDGHHQNAGTPNLAINNLAPDDAGNYQVVVTNATGVVTSAVVKVVIHAVDAANLNPLTPYASWSEAANNIQDAIDAASAGDIVLVTNGIYATGGMVMAGDLTNRVAPNKAITVMSVNGYKVTTIQGAWDPVATNGPGAVRCAWVGNGATLSGFTLQNGATRATGDSGAGGALETGGGAYCVSTAAFIFNCLLTNNSAVYGGGIGNGTLNNSLVVANAANYGGGAYYTVLNNCTIRNNLATTLNQGGGIYLCAARNSIVIGNNSSASAAFSLQPNNYNPVIDQQSFSFSCTDPLPSRNVNIDANPGFLDLFHITLASPGFGAGSAAYASGFDLDDEPWNDPPSMGCDEVVASNLIGALSVDIVAASTNLLVNRGAFFSGTVAGNVSRVAWDYGDGVTVTNSGASGAHLWASPGDYTVTFTAYNNDNPAGVSAAIVIHVRPLITPQLQSAGMVEGAFQFEFTGQSGANYSVQYTTNLSPPVAWQTLKTILISDGGVIQINDPATTNDQRFYRVLAQ